MNKRAALVATVYVGWIVLALAVLVGIVGVMAFVFDRHGTIGLLILTAVTVLSCLWVAAYRAEARATERHDV